MAGPGLIDSGNSDADRLRKMNGESFARKAGDLTEAGMRGAANLVRKTGLGKKLEQAYDFKNMPEKDQQFYMGCVKDAKKQLAEEGITNPGDINGVGSGDLQRALRYAHKVKMRAREIAKAKDPDRYGLDKDGNPKNPDANEAGGQDVTITSDPLSDPDFGLADFFKAQDEGTMDEFLKENNAADEDAYIFAQLEKGNINITGLQSTCEAIRATGVPTSEGAQMLEKLGGVLKNAEQYIADKAVVDGQEREQPLAEHAKDQAQDLGNNNVSPQR